jgi:hypothetical protein
MKFKDFLNRASINADGFIKTPPPLIISLRDREETVNYIIIDTMLVYIYASTSKPKFILVILLYNNVVIYNSIKALAQTKHGMYTIYIIVQKFLKE